MNPPEVDFEAVAMEQIFYGRGEVAERRRRKKGVRPRAAEEARA